MGSLLVLGLICPCVTNFPFLLRPVLQLGIERLVTFELHPSSFWHGNHSPQLEVSLKLLGTKARRDPIDVAPHLTDNCERRV